MPRKKKLTDEEVLQRARTLFLEHGFRLSMDTIARDLGVTATAIYKRFGSKLSFFHQCVLARPMPSTRFFEVLGEPDERPVELQLLEIADAAAAHAGELMSLALLLSRSAVPLADASEAAGLAFPAKPMVAIERWMKAAAERGLIHCADPAFLARHLFGSIYSLSCFQASDAMNAGRAKRGEGVEDLSWQVVGLLLPAILPEPPALDVRTPRPRPALGAGAARARPFASLEDAVASFQDRLRGCPPLGGTIKWDFGPIGAMWVDATDAPLRVEADNRPADCTLVLDWQTFNDLETGVEAPITALSSGRMRSEGRAELAIKLNLYETLAERAPASP